MKQTYALINDTILGNLITAIYDMPIDGTHEVVLRDVEKDKTLKQLGALFAVWIKYLAQTTADSEDYIHRMLKAKFLARIYVTDPITEAQQQWVELLAVYQEAGEQNKLERHAKRISLSWATLKQMKLYMDAIEQHYQAVGIPLPVPDKYHNNGQAKTDY